LNQPNEGIAKDLDAFLARYGGKIPKWFDASPMAWLTVSEDVAYLMHIFKEALCQKDKDIRAKIEELKKGIVRYPHQVLIPESLFLAQKEKIEPQGEKIRGLENNFSSAQDLLEIASMYQTKLKNQIESQARKIEGMRKALKEIQEMFDGEADIDINGGPNRSMEIDGIIDTALGQSEGER